MSHRRFDLVTGAWLILWVSASNTVDADTEIHRCAQDDGTIAFQETPCTNPVEETDGNDQDETNEPVPVDDFFDFANPFDEPEKTAVAADPAPAPLPSRDRAACEKTTRDAIDAIDAEMREGYTTEEGSHYLAELMDLTRQLRSCKQL